MQQVIFQQTGFKPIHTQATRVFPDKPAGLEDREPPEKTCHDESSPLRVLFSLLANVLGGLLLLSLMYVLPHVIAKILS